MVAVTILGVAGRIRPATLFLMMSALILASYALEWWDND